MTESLTEVALAHTSKPDRAEPWRYVCPDCGGQVEGSSAAKGKFRCHSCGNEHRSDDLLDKKTGKSGVEA